MDQQHLMKRDRLNRLEAAAYITAQYFPCSKATLDKHASKFTGPDYSSIGPNAGGRAFYQADDLDAWCNKQFQIPLNRKKRDWAEQKLAKAG